MQNMRSTNCSIYSFDVPVESVSEPPSVFLDLSMLSGNLRKGDLNNGKDCWSIPDCNNFRVRSKHFLIDRSKASC